MKRYKISSLKKHVINIFRMISGIYLLFLIYVFFLHPDRTGGAFYNFIPFKTITEYIIMYDKMNFDTWFLNLFGNIILFIPFGFLLPILSKKFKNIFKIVYILPIASLIIEILEYTLEIGSFDVDDILLNTIGGLIGYYIFLITKSSYEYLMKRKLKIRVKDF